ncbi:hypothetical protein TBLA_0C03410 [Henningerozyma blattae CBS 6284]|uniref:NAD-dependent epimerase/dehydratase domain-containing protein n=1 Tax=Henningerozyma blattae (strain ATCC 34711 / CBS 6284 / DSM 70876 / NBRC 10599 / NRRL Y-10934 / UCD 77-7) TaxID=1071380 RepID=I2H192_HENB6|nr:hypothetical protein TBLA_0C03410 [Tetrapisispora blattae CBS 6284]CCH60144.1 hypothetical protein TBLA_0C03410 [Tetrapisispora blattae CBS 6284]
MTIHDGVLITGANGYIAEYIIDHLLQENYVVIGTVRNKSKADKIMKLFNYSPDLKIVVIPDLTIPHVFRDIFIQYQNQIEYVIHTAGPLGFDYTNIYEEVIRPSVEGTLNLMRDISRYGGESIKKFILTSSSSAIEHPDGYVNNKSIHTEETWPSITQSEGCKNAVNGYYASKTFAEKEAWNFYKQGNLKNCKMCSINPDYVMGPRLFDEEVVDVNSLNYSLQVINEFMDVGLDYKIDDRPMGRCIDVRDVTRAHIMAMENDSFIDKRIVLSNEIFSEPLILQYLYDEIPELHGKIPNPSKTIIQKSPKSDENRVVDVDYSKSAKLLNFQYIPLRQSVADTGKQLLKLYK